MERNANKHHEQLLLLLWCDTHRKKVFGIRMSHFISFPPYLCYQLGYTFIRCGFFSLRTFQLRSTFFFLFSLRYDLFGAVTEITLTISKCQFGCKPLQWKCSVVSPLVSIEWSKYRSQLTSPSQSGNKLLLLLSNTSENVACTNCVFVFGGMRA